MIRRHSSDPPIAFIDLNNFARFPTLPVGLITSVLRRAGHEVHVISPLSVGVAGIPRAARAKPWGLWDEKLRWWSATTRSRAVKTARDALRALPNRARSSRSQRLMGAVHSALEQGPGVLLISTYLMYHDPIRRICAAAAERGIPVVVGGPAFHTADTRHEWLRIPGLTGIYAGEAEGAIVEIVAQLLGASDPSPIPGFTRAGQDDAGLAEPLTDLDALPFPDYDDFPWERYPNRIVSMLTARGCGWGVCRFCSDVVTVAGRGFRTRSLNNVLAELRHHRERYDTSLFCFSDLKLNSDLELWRGLHDRLQSAVPGAKWTCAVHVGPRTDEGLTRSDMVAARRAGLVRVTTGLETASTSLLSAMRKGTQPERLGEFLATAHEAGISTRVTAFTGFPAEEPGDIDQTTAFLRDHGQYLERVHLSRLLVQSGTPLENDLRSGLLEDDSVQELEPDPLQASSRHVNARCDLKLHRRSTARLLQAVHEINRRPLRSDARELEGAM